MLTESPSRSPKTRLWAIAPAVALALVSLAPVVAVSAAPRTPLQIAAVFPPWWSSEQIVRAAGGAGGISGFGGARNIVIVVAADDGLPRRLNAAGALLQLDPIFSGLCEEPTEPADV